MARSLSDILGDTSEPKSGTNACTPIVALLFKARNDAHITHLMQRDKTLAKHSAMGIFYEEILDKIDSLMETSMGLYYENDIQVPSSSRIQNPLEYFTDLYNKIDIERKKVKESFLQNQIDTIQEEIVHCLYRLQFIQT